MNPDVLVIGGGSAGVAAALAAARQGAVTLLVERHGFFGGAGTASLVHSFCGLYEPPQTAEATPRVANPGLPAELERELLAQGIAHGPVRMGKVDVLLHQPWRLAAFYDRWVSHNRHLAFLLHTEVARIETENDRVVEVGLLCRGTHTTLRPRTVVDASGDAVVAVMTGHPLDTHEGVIFQRPAYIVGISGTAADLLENDGPLQLAGWIASAIQKKDLPPACAGAHFRRSLDGDIFMTLDLTGDAEDCAYDPNSPASLTKLEMIGRDTAFRLVDHLRAQHPAFASARITALPARAGIRESRRWLGETQLEQADILHSRQPADTVAWASWPVEGRETARGPRMQYPHEPKAAGIPLGALRARDLKNVFLAGRCISASHGAQASIRVMGTALATGQAAGIAAATFATDETCPTAALAQQVRDILTSLKTAT
ncbi:MAG: FAD-dependent oxidoreductase [Prosthecobacter sp.]